MRRNQQSLNQSSGLHTRTTVSPTIDPRYPNGPSGGFARTAKFDQTRDTQPQNRQNDSFRGYTRAAPEEDSHCHHCHCPPGPSPRGGHGGPPRHGERENLTQTYGRPGYDGYTTTGGRPGYDGFATTGGRPGYDGQAPGSRGGPNSRGNSNGRGNSRESEQPYPGPPAYGQGPPRGGCPFRGRGRRFRRGRRAHKFHRHHGCFGCHFHPKIHHVFNPKKFSSQYNPWSANMWSQDFQKPTQGAPIGTKPTRPSQSGSSSSNQKPSYQRPPQPVVEQQPVQQTPVEQTPVQEPVQQQPIEEEFTEEEVLTEEENEQENQEQEQLQTEADELFQFASIEEFQELRHHATESSALTQLRELATDITKETPSKIEPAAASCLICCNSYTKPSYQLGVGPINDAITVAANHKVQGYTVYFVHNPKAQNFLNVLKVFFQKTTHYLTVYYTGHGSQVTDTHGDEDDKKDEVMVFDDGYLTDDELVQCIKQYHNGKAHTILMSDCCHSGTLWDIPTDVNAAAKLPANILSLSAAADTQTAKQTTLDKNCQGCFTYYFWTLVRNNPAITPDEIEEILNKSLKKFTQELVMIPTRADLLQKPMFPLLNR